MARFTKEDAKAMAILDVAQSLGMELKQNSSQEWYWVEHDSFKINTRKNRFDWYSRDIHGDVIDLVKTIKEVDYKKAMHYLRTGEFPQAEMTQPVKEPFNYVLGRFEQPFVEARAYLKEVRGLSDDTINFFDQAGVLAQANKKAPDDYLEPVVVFKNLDKQGNVIGASLQGIVPNKERYEGKGYLKQIAYNSDGLSGMSVDIGTPRRLVFAEAPIDLMSYYEANKGNLSDVRLVAMDGLKAGTVSRYTMELLAELQGKADYKLDLSKVGEALEKLAKVTTFFQNGKNSDLITLAVDNDKAGRDFIEQLQAKGIPVQPDLPPLSEGAIKMDWNDYLKSQKAGMVLEDSLPRDNSRLAQAERKLERLNGELVEKADKVYAHTRQANGQPMNDKRGGGSFFRKQDKLEGSVFTKLDEIKKQEERVEKLRYQKELKERGFNKQGNGLVMSIDNIPRIKGAIEAFEKGEPGFTRATINRYRKELVKLEAMKERLEATRISPGAQHLIDEGLVSQWSKQPTLYFVKGLRKVAFELTDSGEFQVSAKYQPKTSEEVDKVEELLSGGRNLIDLSIGKELPSNIQANEKIQELLGQVEELGQTAYFWVTEEDLGQPEEIVSQLDNWFSSEKVDSTYKSDLFELVAGDYTYMIEFRDGSISLQNMEDYSQYISNRIEEFGVSVVISELESVIHDFNQVKNSITEGMNKELDALTSALTRDTERLDKQTTINNEKEQNMAIEHESETMVQATEPRFELEASELGRPEQPITNFDELQMWMLQQFNSVFVGEGYFKTYLQIYSLDEHGQEVASQIRFDVGHGQSDFNPRREHIRDYLVEHGYIQLQAPEQSQEQIEVIFHSSDEPLLSRYSSGEIIPYTEFVSILYPENTKLFNENPRTGPSVSFSNDGGTWFGLRTADGQMLVERFRYDVGLEGESISDRLKRILSPAHLEQIRQIDTDFDIPSYIEDKNKELGIEVKLYRDKEHIDTLDFNDLINHPNIEEMANELGHTSLLSYSEEFTIEILDKRLNQSQLTALLDQIIELGKEKDELKQFLTEQLTSLSQSTRPDTFRALTENERIHISEFFKTLIPNVTTSYEFTEEGVEYLSYRIRNMEFASSHPELSMLSPDAQYQSLLKFFDKHYGKPFPLPSDQTVMGIELLQEKFGYNPKLPLAVYRDSAQNMDRIAEKEEEAFHSTFDKTMFAKSLELVQKYSLQEVMEGIDIWSGGDEARLEALNSDLRDISLQPLKDFVERYIDPSLYLSHGFEDSPLASLSFQDLADLSHEKGLLDVNSKLVNQKDHMEKEKAPEQTQGQEKNAEGTIGDFPDKQEAAPLPEATKSQPLNDLSPNQTQPQPLLHFSISEQRKSIKKRGYHPASDNELVKLNRYSSSLREAAQWYLSEVSDSTIHYIYKDNEGVNSLQVSFDKDKFIHLTGIFPYKEGYSADKLLIDIANGQGTFDDILLANKGAAFDKLKVLPELPAIIEARSFYFDDLSDVPKLHSLDMDKAIKSGDEDIVLALRTVDGETFPASLMKLRSGLHTQLNNAKEKTILGIYRERDGLIKELDINKEYVKDGGKEFLTILQNRQLEPVITQEEPSLQERFTSVLDGVKELGFDLFKDRNEEEFKLFHQLYEQNHNDLNQTVMAALKQDLVDINSNFFAEWKDDFLYQEKGISSVDVLNGKLTKEEYEAQVSALIEEKSQPQQSFAELLESKDSQALFNHLKEGMKEYANSDKYKQFLQAISKFHDYSIYNVHMMVKQKPDISLVASYQKWKTDFDRQVQKGEKGIKIWVPMTFKAKDRYGQPILDEDGKEKTVTRFKLGTVFDVSQTAGKELPKPVYNLESNVPDYQNIYRAARHVSQENGVKISFQPIDSEANGYYHIEKNEIVIADKKMSEAQILKTLFHEMAHSELHHLKDGFNSSERELQAESIAYVVANHFGIDTSEYSFAYLHNWSLDKQGYEDLENQLKVVQAESKSLINRIDKSLELVKNKSLTNNKLQSKIAQVKQKQEQEKQLKSSEVKQEKSKKQQPTPKEL